MSTLRAALAERVVVADGAMGTMLQASDATAEDFAGYCATGPGEMQSTDAIVVHHPEAKYFSI